VTLGEKQTEASAKAALKLLSEDDRIAVEAWIDDRERAARSTAAMTATGIEAAKNFGGASAILLVGGTILLSGLKACGAFEHAPPGCPVCPPVVECATPTALDWGTLTTRYSSTPLSSVRYAATKAQECVSLGDTTLCAPLRVPAALPPQVTP
jgi:hypothetical protein